MSCCVIPALVCCAGSACRCCCPGLPSVKSSFATRMAYLGLYISGIVVAAILTIKQIRDAIGKITDFCHVVYLFRDKADCNNMDDQLSRLVGFSSVYRICFALFLFFIFFAIIMINVKSSSDFRSYIQNGFWFFKSLMILGLTVGAFYIHDSTFDVAMSVIGYIGGFLFYIIMITSIVDFSDKWTDSWNEKAESSGKTHYFAGVVIFTIFFYACFIALVAILFVYYGYSGCKLHQFFISFNFILCVLISIFSNLPPIKEYKPRSGLLQASIVCLYVMFITWTSMSSSVTCNPVSTCNSDNSTTIDSKNYIECLPYNISFDVVIPFLLMLFISIYSAVSEMSNDTIEAVKGTSDEDRAERGATGESSGGDNKWVQEVVDDEEEKVAYSYTFYHLIYTCATLFAMMTLTQWNYPKDHGNKNAAVWVKIASSWVSVLIYIWILIAPRIFKDRVFD